jgi:hypothetical protein
MQGLVSTGKVIIMTCAFLVAADVLVNLLFAMPEDPRIKPNRLQQYFDYGRSIEGKLRYMVRDTDELSGPIVRTGWLSENEDLPVKAEHENGRLFAVYGQSMSGRVAREIGKQDKTATIRARGGPAAPLGHTYELFRRDLQNHTADVIVLGIFASGVNTLHTMTPTGWAFEVPTPYTYPRWSLVDGQLVSKAPRIQSLEQLRTALHTPTLWSEFGQHLAQHDASFSSLLFYSDWTDTSAFLRLAKRGYGQHHQDRISALYSSKSSQGPESVGEIARAIVRQFVEDVRAASAIPVLILFHDKGTGDKLYQLLSEDLDKYNIPYITTHEIASANDPSSFLADGHFRRDLDVEFARRILELPELAR